MWKTSEIKAQLLSMKAPKNKPVIVHTSLKAIGKIEGGAEAFLETLIEYFTEEGGLLCIPTHTWDNVEKYMKIPSPEPIEEPTLDMNSSHTCIGVLPTVAAAHPLAHRSMHPTHSMAVFGENTAAENFIKAEENAEFSVSPNGCYGNIYKMGGYVLLIGVDETSNTLIHCIEEEIGVKNRHSKEKINVKIKLKSGEIIPKSFYHVHAYGIGDVSEFYQKFEPAIRAQNAVTDGKIGNANAELINAEKLKIAIEKVYKKANGKEILANDSPLEKSLYL